jgi:hypothetical protein
MSERPKFGEPGSEGDFGTPDTLTNFYEHMPITPEALAPHLRHAVTKLLSLPLNHPFRQELENIKRLALMKGVPLKAIGLQPPDYEI